MPRVAADCRLGVDRLHRIARLDDLECIRPELQTVSASRRILSGYAGNQFRLAPRPWKSTQRRPAFQDDEEPRSALLGRRSGLRSHRTNRTGSPDRACSKPRGPESTGPHSNLRKCKGFAQCSRCTIQLFFATEDGNLQTCRYGTVAKCGGLLDCSIRNRHVELDRRKLLGGHTVIAQERMAGGGHSTSATSRCMNSSGGIA
jgi:hypothetical protein